MASWPTAPIIRATVNRVFTGYFVRDLAGHYTAIGGGGRAYAYTDDAITNAEPMSLVRTADLERLQAALADTDHELAAATRALCAAPDQKRTAA